MRRMRHGTHRQAAIIMEPRNHGTMEHPLNTRLSLTLQYSATVGTKSRAAAVPVLGLST
jgi:hypothetical protein